jgi:hypothetical protein
MICQKHLEGLVVPEPSIPKCCAVEVAEVVVVNREEFWATAVPERTIPNEAIRRIIFNKKSERERCVCGQRDFCDIFCAVIDLAGTVRFPQSGT